MQLQEKKGKVVFVWFKKTLLDKLAAEKKVFASLLQEII